METIHLTLDAKYVPTWGMTEGLREVVQNWLDAGGEGKPTLADGCLTLDNPGARMDRESLLIGASTKAGKAESRGEFGEGLKLGALALLRDGCDVRVHVPGEVWNARLDKHPSLNREVLAWDIESVPDDHKGVTVEVFGLTGEDWAHMRNLFRWGSNPTRSDLLLSENHKGRVFVKGIFVIDDDKLAYGYDLHDLPTDRDRRLVDARQLARATQGVFARAINDGTISGKEDMDVMLKETLEGGFDYHLLGESGKQAITDAWTTDHRDEVPCHKWNYDQKKKLQKLGKKVKSVPTNLESTLTSQGIKNAQAVLADLKDGRLPHKPTRAEQVNLDWAVEQLNAVVPHEASLKFQPTRFMDDFMGCVYEDGIYYISDQALKSRGSALAQAAIAIEKGILGDLFDHILEQRGLVSA